MENFNIVGISLGIFLALTTLGILVVLGFGLKNLFSGRHDWQKMLTVAFPFILFGGLFAVFGDFTQAGIGTLIGMILVMVVVILLSGLRSTFKS